MSENRLLITPYREGVLSMLIQNDRLASVSYYRERQTGSIGDIYVAKVLNIVSNINAAFIDYRQGMRGYLPLQPGYTPVLVNRAYDGRLLAGDEVLVQLEKEAIRTKDAVFTTNLSLSGRYCVVTNANTKKSVSNKINKDAKSLLQQTIPNDTPYGLIVRTNARQLLETHPSDYADILRTEYDRMLGQMSALLHEGVHRTCYSRLYAAPAGYLTDIRDAYFDDYDAIVTDDTDIHAALERFLSDYGEQTARLSLYDNPSYPLKKIYSVDTRLGELLSPKVWLKSGAYLVIEQTEAMYVIDVNSGKNNSRKNNDAYIADINLEAAAEVMRQIALRNLSGIIMVDFINMEDEERNNQLLEELRRLAAKDRITTTVVDMTPLGLIEITRKKTKKPFKEQIN